MTFNPPQAPLQDLLYDFGHCKIHHWAMGNPQRQGRKGSQGICSCGSPPPPPASQLHWVVILRLQRPEQLQAYRQLHLVVGWQTNSVDGTSGGKFWPQTCATRPEGPRGIPFGDLL